MTFRLLFVSTIPLLLTIGCMQEPELKADFGPEVPQKDFAEKLSQIEVPDPYTIKKNEYAYFVESTVIQDQIYQLNKRWAYTITDKREDAENYIFTYVKELREYDQGEEKISQNQEDITLAKKTPASQSVLDFSPLPLFRTLYAPASSILSGLRIHARSPYRTRSTARVSYHNLKFEKTSLPVPEFVQQRSDCGGLSAEKCRGALKAYVLSFDQVIWQAEQGQRYSILWIFSPDIPYFGSAMFPDTPGVIKSCVTTQVPYRGQRVKVTQCAETKDFTFGHD